MHMKSAEVGTLITIDELNEEAKHVKLLKNGNGIQYDIIRRDDNTFDRIQFVLNESGYGSFEVAMKTKTESPVMRGATIDEIIRFITVVDTALPDSPLLLKLCQTAESQGEQLRQIAARNGTIASIRQAVK